jgi:hypothetical protein
MKSLYICVGDTPEPIHVISEGESGVYQYLADRFYEGDVEEAKIGFRLDIFPVVVV